VGNYLHEWEILVLMEAKAWKSAVWCSPPFDKKRRKSFYFTGGRRRMLNAAGSEKKEGIRSL